MSNKSYYVTVGDRDIGPVTCDQVVAAIRAGKVGREAQVCVVGAAEWKRIDEAEAFAVEFAAAPPPPKVTPPAPAKPIPEIKKAPQQSAVASPTALPTPRSSKDGVLHLPPVSPILDPRAGNGGPVLAVKREAEKPVAIPVQLRLPEAPRRAEAQGAASARPTTSPPEGGALGMTTKLVVGCATVVIGGLLIASKQALSEMLWGEWTYPRMEKIQGGGILIVLVGLVFVVLHFATRSKRPPTPLEHRSELGRAGIATGAEQAVRTLPVQPVAPLPDDDDIATVLSSGDLGHLRLPVSAPSEGVAIRAAAPESPIAASPSPALSKEKGLGVAWASLGPGGKILVAGLMFVVGPTLFCLVAILTTQVMFGGAPTAAAPASPATTSAASVPHRPSSPRPALLIPPGTEIAAGYYYSCARLTDGSVACWGANSEGQLGDGTTTDRLTPTPVLGLTDAVEISTGELHACARRTSGAVVCWGNNAYGQIGDASITTRFTPVAVSGLSGVVEVALGFDHSCARLTDATVMCWGRNDCGQLGDGTTTSRITPVPVSGLSGVVEVSVGYHHSCARLTDSTVRCWGLNFGGVLGDGTATWVDGTHQNNRLTPVAVSGLSGVVEVALGGDHSCARLTGGDIRCWGENAWGQLGDGTRTTRLTPVAVSGLSGAVQLALGASHSCALLTDGSVRCWGYNSEGQLGDRTRAYRRTPVAVSGLSGGVELALGYGHTCARLSDGSVRCWGYNFSGQLGDGTVTRRLTPTPVVGL